jgi:RNA polymerase sigma-32 factor
MYPNCRVHSTTAGRLFAGGHLFIPKSPLFEPPEANAARPRVFVFNPSIPYNCRRKLNSAGAEPVNDDAMQDDSEEAGNEDFHGPDDLEIHPEIAVEGDLTLPVEAEFIDFESAFPAEEEVGLIRYDPLKKYLLEISRYPILDREEEHRLAVSFRDTDDREAAYRLVTANLRLVVKIAMIYHKVYQNILDLIQEGNLGLIMAIKKFDPDRGNRLNTYAQWWIKAYILKFLLDNSRLVKVGTTNTRRKILMNLNREKKELEARGIVPTTQLLAESMGVDEKEIMDVEVAMSGSDISLDTPVGSGDGNLKYEDTLQALEQSVDDKIAQNEFRSMLEQKFSEFSTTLTEREQVILNRRLIAEKPDTLQEIADIYGISREAVRVAEKKLTAKIKQYMIDSFGDIREIEFNLGR